jgi:hypothetical protein
VTDDEMYAAAVSAGDVELAETIGKRLDELDAADHARLESVTLHAAALWYAQHGVAVFPCEPRGKKPITGNGFHDATLDAGQVGWWWRATPGANIGAPTGIGFDVIDVDGREGVVYVWAGAMVLPPLLGHSLTPRDGGHHLFVPASGRGNTTALQPGVDYRGVGGYVILPPSVGANGTRYTWLRPLTVSP